MLTVVRVRLSSLKRLLNTKNMASNLPTLLTIPIIGLVVSASLMNMDNGVNASINGQSPILRNKRGIVSYNQPSRSNSQ